MNKEKERATEEVEGDPFVFGTSNNGAVFHPVLLGPGPEDENGNVMADGHKDDGARVTYDAFRPLAKRVRIEVEEEAARLGGLFGEAS